MCLRFTIYCLGLQGYNFTAELKKRMDFQNPYILEEVVRQFHIDETGERLRHARSARRARVYSCSPSPLAIQM